LLKVCPEWFTLLFPKLQDILSDEGNLVDWVKFLKKALMKSSHIVTEFTTKLYNYFLA